MLAFALLLAATVQDHPAIGPPDGELSSLPPRCKPATEGEITVCGNSDVNSRYRLMPLDRSLEPRPVRARLTLPGGGQAELEAVQRGVGGVSVPAAMVTLKIPLGGKKKAQMPEEK
jgi:hypothetical protein